MRDAMTASFYRVEGTLLPRHSVTAAAWLAVNAQDLRSRLPRLAQVVMSTALRAPGPLQRPHVARRLAWGCVRGMSEDRLIELGQAFFTSQLQPKIAAFARRLLQQSRAQGHQVVLLSNSPAVFMHPLIAELSATALVAPEFEIREGRATGRLRGPAMNGPDAVTWARKWIEQQHGQWARCQAYSSLGDDSYLLSAVSHPCAVNPDQALRQIAQRLAWPILEA